MRRPVTLNSSVLLLLAQVGNWGTTNRTWSSKLRDALTNALYQVMILHIVRCKSSLQPGSAANQVSDGMAA
jgi:hypothetical protein